MNPTVKMIGGWLVVVAGVVWYVFFYKELWTVVKGTLGGILILAGLLIYLIGKEEKAFIEEEKKLEEELKKAEEEMKKENKKTKKTKSTRKTKKKK